MTDHGQENAQSFADAGRPAIIRIDAVNKWYDDFHVLKDTYQHLKINYLCYPHTLDKN